MIAAPTSMPNPALLGYLFENYYDREVEPEEAGLVSSDWIHSSQFLKVRKEGGSNAMPVSGAFWGCQWNGVRAKVLDQICILTHLVRLPRRREVLRHQATAAKVCRRMGLDPTLTVFRQACSVELLARHLPEELAGKPLRILVIGDGIGVLAASLKSVFPSSTIVMVDIGKSLFFQAYYLQKAYPECSHNLAVNSTDIGNPDFAYCPTEHLEALAERKFDIAVSINSMQEMNSYTVERYFTFLRAHLNPVNLFYCCNRQHREMIGGEISEIMNYPWRNDDRFLVDDYCPWQRYLFARHPAPNGPRVLGFRVPYISYYDGPIIHRLGVLATG